MYSAFPLLSDMERRQTTIVEKLIFVLVAAAIGTAAGYWIRKKLAEAKIASAEEAARKILDDAQHSADARKKESLIEAKEEIHRFRAEAERELKERRSEVQRMERRLQQKEENLDRKIESMEKKEENIGKRELEVDGKQAEINELFQKQVDELERLAGLTQEEAKAVLLSNVEQETRHEMAILIKDLEHQAKEESEKKAREIISLAIQRCAADHAAETTVSVVSLPNDEMKGRIIGREGRNIRTLEALTGIDLIIDDTPEAILISGFDPVRREVARIALEKLISDGRIHPARIEETVEKAQKEVEQRIKDAGEQATFETGIHGLHPELIRLLGRLKYRTSYGQNVLKHSIEVAHLAGIMADELGANSRIARRAGILHDIGKGIDHEVEGPHVQIGVDVLKKYKESREVIHAVEAHHGDVEPTTVEAVLVQAADAISAARPGARRETLESYTKRLEKLESIVTSFAGVDRCFAIQAGREIRIMVKPDEVDDLQMVHVAREIARQIENDVDYPGQIKVNIIRETRAIEYAK